MTQKTAICPKCQTKINCKGNPGDKVKVECPNCGKSGSIVFKDDLVQLDFYPLNEPFAYAKVLKNKIHLKKVIRLLNHFYLKKNRNYLIIFGRHY